VNNLEQAKKSPLTYESLGVRPLINACGIYTDLGGSVLSDDVWRALGDVNREWASIPELLEASGRRIAALTGAEAARIAPGASASIALGVAACIAGRDGDLNEHLPDVDVPRRTVLLQSGHRYKYARCALLAGARLVEMDVDSSDALADELGPEIAAVLHPAHLDGTDGTLELDRVLEASRAAKVPVLVDAAYLSYPIELLHRWAGSGADLVCFSAKYFYGPNSGGFMVGRRDLIDAVEELDFTRFEAGPYLTFGRPFKLDRTAIVGTVLALEAWLQMDHEERWRGYAERADTLLSRLGEAVPNRAARPAQFTLDERLIDEPVNSVVVACDGPEHAATIEQELAGGSPRVFAVLLENELVLCLETVRPDQDEALTERLVSALS
jgi:L-seryl-tRNA(Ser) seleniumtransferase